MSKYPLLSVVGIEIEYMLVDTNTLNISPCSDIILSALAGTVVDEITLGDIAISNELVMHVLEFKNASPQVPNAPLVKQFQSTIEQLQPILTQHQVQLLPTGAHPWMDPYQETKRWPHGNREIYKQFDKIFNCEGHGWANLQSMHVNLPYADDAEFVKLHNTIRLILPLLPALAASTPFIDSKPTGFLDSRLTFYAANQAKIPSISGQIIPEFIDSIEHYKESILTPMYNDIRPFDDEGILQYEWLNSRAAIPKFNHHAIEIRILDTQECVKADIAIAKAVHAILTYWINEDLQILTNPIATERLKALYEQTIKHGLKVTIDNDIKQQLYLPKHVHTIHDAWSYLIAQVSPNLDLDSQIALEYILKYGNLSERLLHACHGQYDHNTLLKIYRDLSNCLVQNQQYAK